MDVVSSVNGVPIRLTDERWAHISDARPDLRDLRTAVLACVTDPDSVHEDREGALAAVKTYPTGRAFVVVYRESNPDDGFIITAWRTSKPQQITRRPTLWTKASSGA